MNLEKVVFGFFLILAMTLNVAFVVGSREMLETDALWVLFAAVVVNMIATVLKLGDRSQVGALMLAAALVADLQLVAAALIWAFAESASGLAPGTVVAITALAAGAIVANIVSVTLLVCETLISGR